MRFNKPYIKLRDYAIKALENEWAFNNPFADFDVFYQDANENETFGISDDDLLQIFFDKYSELKIGKPLPPKDYKVIYNLQIVELNSEQLRYEYLWAWLSSQIGEYLASTYPNWSKKVEAFLKEYNPIENYNMVEHSGASSLTSRIRSSAGKVERKDYVYPFDVNTGDGSPQSRSVTEQDTLSGTDFSPNSAISGFDSDNKSLTFDNMTTPAGNATQVGKLTRSGNIGVTTSQQMLEQELEIRKHNLIDEFMKEVAKVCLLSEWH